MRNTKIVPIFYTCDDTNAKSTVASLQSIINYADNTADYTVCILHTGMSKQNIKKMHELGKLGFNITLEDISCYAKGEAQIGFSSDFVRAFIPEMFPGYHDSILVNSDYVASEDIAHFLDAGKSEASLYRICC